MSGVDFGSENIFQLQKDGRESEVVDDADNVVENQKKPSGDTHTHTDRQKPPTRISYLTFTIFATAKKTYFI